MTENVLHLLYKIGRKDHIMFTEELLEDKGGIATIWLRFCTKSSIVCSIVPGLGKVDVWEVDPLRSEATCSIKDRAEVQSKLL